MRATAQLSHWNTIEIFDYGRNDDGAFYYVMEYLPGLSLADLVERLRPDAAGAGDLPAPPGVRRAARGARVGLDPPRHQAGQPDGRLSRRPSRRDQAAGFRPGQDLAARTSRSSSRRKDTVAGSPLYMAPEQVMHNQPPDRRTDIYGAGRRRLFHLDRPSPVPRARPRWRS